MSREIDGIKDAAGAYRRWALEARKEFINLRLGQDPEIRGLYIRSANRVAKELRQLVLKTPSSYLRKRQLEELEAALRAEAERLKGGLAGAIGKHIERAVDAGAGYSQTVTMDLLKKAGVEAPGLRSVFASVNRQAVETCWARTKKGLHLSDRIWTQGDKYRDTMRDIIQEAVATGQDAAKTAKMLQQYVKQGKQSLAASYPKMMERMGSRIPGDICYEALRLARTEMTAAFGEGTLAAAQASPSYIGMKWVLSHSHPLFDICDHLAAHDEGLGEGVYAPGNEPPFPGHPNCICHLIPVHEQPEEFVKRLKKWKDDPGSDKELENWYNGVYQGKAKEVQKRQKQAAGEALSAALDTAEAVLIKRETEKAIIFADDGTVIFEKAGGKSSVSFTLDECALFANRIFTHNHPNGTSFSAQDVAFAATWDLKEIRACGQYYRYRLVRPAEGWSHEYWIKTIKPLMDKHDKKVFQEFTALIRSGKITPEEGNLKHWHEVWSRVAKEAGLNYGREKW